MTIEIETDQPARVHEFASALLREAPMAAQIEKCAITEMPGLAGYLGFSIALSGVSSGRFTLVSADLATCAECLSEIEDPTARRFGYPFTNCTNCGPRYSITEAVPYDRARTTMREFEMCDACAAEYADVSDRRFHAEPIACPRCGPNLSVDLATVVQHLERGDIVAIKGLGGFQLACDAFCVDAIERLRLRKHRSRKPFAVMMRNLQTIERHCCVNAAERDLLSCPSAPIVLLRLRAPCDLPAVLAPGIDEAGVMLPYTPLHHLLFQRSSLNCLVMTSGNISEEPIVVTNPEAERRLAGLADFIVAHNRDIFMRVDDSVARVIEGAPRILRRARGYAPGAIPLHFDADEVLGAGAELKNTFCITKSRYAIVSQHIGDLENAETLEFFEETLANLSRVYHAQPRIIAHDLHPDYLSTRWALSRREPKLAVQHHHAHIASCMAENGINERVIGVAFDGTGYGTDGAIWGGEFLLCDYRGFKRAAHLRSVPLIGGDRAAREPWRMAASYLFDAIGPECFRLDLPCWSAAAPSTWKIVERLLARPALLTSSCGRLFDAISSLCGVSQVNSYEGESAILLEAAARSVSSPAYPYCVSSAAYPWEIDFRPMVRQITKDIAAGRSPAGIAQSFHETTANMVVEVCGKLRESTGVNRVCLSGGSFQNVTLLLRTSGLLRLSGFDVALHSQVPPNDGGISLGQAVIAAAYLHERG